MIATVSRFLHIRVGSRTSFTEESGFVFGAHHSLQASLTTSMQQCMDDAVCTNKLLGLCGGYYRVSLLDH